jgi:hypothetical protein
LVRKQEKMQDFRIVYDRLRSPENRLYLGVAVGLLALTMIVGCLVLYQFIKPSQAATPPLVLAPKDLALTPTEPILTEPAIVLAETSTVPAPKKIVKAATARVKATAKVKPKAGQSCIYSSPGLNQVYPPAPSGSWSPIEHYFCDNGYWDIGKGDVVDRNTGAWGQDGVLEKILIKYDSNGNIADRIFIDPDGDQFSGPKH